MRRASLFVVAWVSLLPACVGQTHDLLSGNEAGAGGAQEPAAGCVDGAGCAGAPATATGTGGKSGSPGSGGSIGTGGRETPDRAGASGVAGDCDALELDACRDKDGCQPIVDVTGYYYGCTPEATCDDAETCASDGSEIALFPTTCLPKYFEEVPYERCERSCSGLARSECTETMGCMAIVSLDGRFWECREQGAGCDDALACALDPTTDEPIAFGNLCLPTGWETVEYGLCPETSPCTNLSAADCDTEEQCRPLEDIDGIYRGCGWADLGCREAETCATNGTFSVVFPTTCLPAGYTEHDSSACGGGCAELDERSCRASEDCEAVVSVDGVFRGCQEAGLGCDPVLTCAASPTFEVATFGGCIPASWSVVLTDDCDREAECAKLATAERCEAAGCDPILDGDGAYYYCQSPRGCGALMTPAYDAKGRCVTFTSTCLPPGWVSAISTGICD